MESQISEVVAEETIEVSNPRNGVEDEGEQVRSEVAEEEVEETFKDSNQIQATQVKTREDKLIAVKLVLQEAEMPVKEVEASVEARVSQNTKEVRSIHKHRIFQRRAR